MRALGGLLLALLLSAGAAAAAPPRAFVLEGWGWGHGVGMSQWGAEGLALHGYGYRRILAHYYPGTELSRALDVRLRVLLGDGRSRFTISSTYSFRVVSKGRVRVLRAGRYSVPGAKLRPPLRFEPGAAPLKLDGLAYRGSIVVGEGADGLYAVDDVPLERYLRGVVPSEMPFHWRQDALEAQAVAARTYALSQRKPAQSYDVFADARDQVYGGLAAETPASSRAVGTTAGEVLTWRGRIALTYYSSTSGGRTEAVSDAVPGAAQVPYLVSVPDPYDSISPHHRWGPLRFSPKGLASSLNVPAVASLALSLNGSGRVAYVAVRWPGGVLRVAGRAFQAALGLPSTWFTVKGASISVAPDVAPAPSPNGDWPVDQDGWTVVLDSVPVSEGLASARRVAGRAEQAGAPGVGVLVSSSFSSLRTGYYVVYSGVYASSAAAADAARALAGRFPAAYVRHVAL